MAVRTEIGREAHMDCGNSHFLNGTTVSASVTCESLVNTFQ